MGDCCPDLFGGGGRHGVLLKWQEDVTSLVSLTPADNVQEGCPSCSSSGKRMANATRAQLNLLLPNITFGNHHCYL